MILYFLQCFLFTLSSVALVLLPEVNALWLTATHLSLSHFGALAGVCDINKESGSTLTDIVEEFIKHTQIVRVKCQSVFACQESGDLDHF